MTRRLRRGVPYLMASALVAALTTGTVGASAATAAPPNAGTAGRAAATASSPAHVLGPGGVLLAATRDLGASGRAPAPSSVATTPPPAAPAASPPGTAALQVGPAAAPPATAPPPSIPPTPTPPTTQPAAATAPTTASAPPADSCAAALAYLAAHAAPDFHFECPGWADNHQAMTCINIPGLCPGTRLIAIAVVCPASYMNEASNSWVLIGESTRPIDPYGHC